MPDSTRRSGLVSVAVYPETKEAWLEAAAEDPNADSLSQFVRVAVQRYLRDRAVGGRAELFDVVRERLSELDADHDRMVEAASRSASRSEPMTMNRSGRSCISPPSRPRRWQLICSNRLTRPGTWPMNRPRVTARIVRTEDGETYHEYEVSGVAYGSLDAVSRTRCSLTVERERLMKLVCHD